MGSDAGRCGVEGGVRRVPTASRWAKCHAAPVCVDHASDEEYAGGSHGGQRVQ